MSRTLMLATALALVAPAALSAQVCQGFASFASGPVQLGAALEFSDDVTIYGAGIGFGAVSGAFVRGEVGRAEDDESDGSATLFGINGGWQASMGLAPSALQLCPVAGFTYVDGEGEATASEIMLGLSLGAMMSSSQALGVAPFGTISFRRASTELETALGTLESDDNYGALDLGVGFIANEWITIRPAVTIPFAEPDDFEVDVSYGVRFAFNFGGGPR